MKKDSNNKQQNDEMKNEDNIKEEDLQEEKKLNEDENESGNENEQVSELEEKVEDLETQLNEMKDKFLRKSAEFENYKRRTENDQLNLLKYSAESFILKLLPVVDDFERSLEHMEKASDVETVKKGIEMVYNKFMKILQEQGVHKIEAEGEPFDVDYHEALMQRKAEGTEPHTVLDVIETGYKYKDKVIRHAKVVVSEELTEESNNNKEEKE